MKICESFSSSESCNTVHSPFDPPQLTVFTHVMQDEIAKIISKSPTKSCLLDPLPTFFIKECIDILLPSITKLVNFSLSEGLDRCLQDVKEWMSASKLKLNPDKTEFILFGSKKQKERLNECFPDILGNHLHPTKSVRNLGVWFDSDFSFSKHVQNVCKGCFSQLRDQAVLDSGCSCVGCQCFC